MRNIRALRMVSTLPECPDSRGVSGFAVPKTCLVSACRYSVGTAKRAIPDRITAGLEGWNLEPIFNDNEDRGLEIDTPVFWGDSLGGNGRLTGA